MTRRRGFLLFAFLLTGLLITANVPNAARAEACHPAVDPGEDHYAIGYGSLMETASKERTWTTTGESLPVMLRGFARSWNARGRDIGFSTTFLGVRPNPEGAFVAALYRVFSSEDFAAGDAREYIYCRAQVPPAQITMLDGSAVPDAGKIWIYLLKPESDRAADRRFPIVQSYVDIFLSGCVEMADLVADEDFDFLSACVTTTGGWPLHWVNDRIYPRRPVHEPNAARIDALLHRLLPAQFEAIRIE